MSEKKKNSRFRRTLRRVFLGRGVIIAVSIMLVYVLAGFFLAPYLVKRYVPQLAQEHLQHDARIGEVRINPFLFTFEADDFLLTETDGRPIIGFDGFFVDFELSSLFRWAWTFRQIELVKPVLKLVFEPDGSINLARMIPKPDESTMDTGTEPLRVVLYKIAIKEGEIDIADQRPTTPATVKISPINLELKNISTLPEKKGPYSLAATTDDGTKLNWTGEVFLNPLRSTGSIVFEDIQAATLYEFVSDAINIESPEGLLRVSTEYQVDLSESDPQLTFSNLDVHLSDLLVKLDGAANPLFNIQKTEFNEGRFDLAARQLEFGRVAIGDGVVRLAVDEQGILDLKRVIKSKPPDGSSATNPPEEDEGLPAADEETPWRLKVGSVKVGDIAFDYRDASVDPESVLGIDALNVKLSFEAETGGNRTNLLAQKINISLDNVHAGLAEVSEPLVRVNQLVIQDAVFDLLQRALKVSRIGFEGGHIVMERASNGEVNLLRLVAPPESRTVQRRSEEAAAKGTPWQFAVGTIEFAELSTSISDRTLKPDGQIINIDPLNISFSEVDGKSPMGFNLDLKIREGGGMTASGIIDPTTVSVKSDVNITEMSLTPFQPIIDSVANLVLHSGTFSSQGKLVYGQRSAGPDFSYDGGFKVDELKITETDSDETLIGWDGLRSDQFKLNLKPDQLDVKELKLVKPVIELIIHKDGSVNLVKVIKDKQASGGPSGGGVVKVDKNKNFPVNVKKVKINDAIVDFADLTLIPQFGTKIEALSGVVAGVSSSRDARAQVDLKGKVDPYGQAKIGGEINIFEPVGFTDITMDFRNIEMSSLSPYSGKFAGRKIDSGKLSINLEYKIDKGQLQGDHQIIVDRIKLGENVDSPDATNLPLDLAVALMEDTKGVIDIGLPVRGDLNNPEFSYGHLIGQALANLITKIVTAPFRVLGGMVPGGSNSLDTVEFEPGQNTLPPPEKEKIKMLAEALQQRPQLSIDVQGRYSAEADGIALKELSVRYQVAKQLGTTLAEGEDPGPIDFGHPETQQAVESIYRERFGGSELEKLKEGLDKGSTEGVKSDTQTEKPAKAEDPGELSKAVYSRLVESEPLDDSVLIELAVSRGQAIMTELVSEGAIASDRVRDRGSAVVPEGEPVSGKLSLEVAGKTK